MKRTHWQVTAEMETGVKVLRITAETYDDAIDAAYDDLGAVCVLYCEPVA